MKTAKFIYIIFLTIIVLSCSKTVKRTLVVACMGDSLTESRFGNYPLHLQKFFLSNNIKAKVISLGRPGNTSGEYLKYLQKTNPLKNINADIIVLMLGTNDVRIDGDYTPTYVYRENMLNIISTLKKQVKEKNIDPQIFLATIPPVFITDLKTFNRESARRVKEEIVPAIIEIAKKNKLHLIDINTFFLRNRILLPGIHPNPKGYFNMAKFIFKKVSKNIRIKIRD